MFDKRILMNKKQMFLKKLIWMQMLGMTGGSSDVYTTFTGNPVQFNAPKAHSFKSFSFAIEPVQDLHGYDSPWPAGGGTNLLNFPNPVTATGEGKPIDAQALDKAIPAGEYTVGITSSAAIAWQVIFKDASNNNVGTFSSPGGTVGRQTKTATLSATASKITIYVNGATTLTNIMMNTGSTALAYAPYSNECPISGWTGAKLYRTGKNLCEPTEATYKNESGTWFNGTDIASVKNALNALPVGEYTLSFKFDVLTTVSGATSWGILIHNTARGYIDGRQNGQHDADETLLFSKTFSVTESNKGKFDHVYMYSGGGSHADVYWYDFQLELGSTASSYEPYTGTSLSLSWSDHGTVYGGTATWNGGDSWTVTVDRAKVDASELSLSYSSSLDGWLSKVLSGYVLDYTNPSYIAEQWRAHTWSGRNQGDVTNTDSNRLLFVTTDTENAPQGAICLELATPTSFTITSADLFGALKGENNVWADTGSVTLEAIGEEIQLNSLQSLNMLLGNRYVNNHTEEDLSDDEALNILLGGNER